MKYILLSILILPFTIAYEGWLNYTDESTWGSEICTTGHSQSPINIPSKSSCIHTDNHVTIDSINYTTLSNVSLQFVHGYKYMVDASNGGFINVTIGKNKLKYKLLDAHFHLNSEHLINKKQYKVEMHLVHTLDGQYQSSEPIKKFLVIGVLFDIGKENPFIKTLNFQNQSAISELDLAKVISEHNFYFYEGGLTTPKCDEEVNWIIIDNIFKMSKSQFEEIQAYIGKDYPNGNNRKIQELFNRKVYYVLRKKQGFFSYMTALFFIIFLL